MNSCLTLLRTTENRKDPYQGLSVYEITIMYATLDWYWNICGDVYRWNSAIDIITPFTEY